MSDVETAVSAPEAAPEPMSLVDAFKAELLAESEPASKPAPIEQEAAPAEAAAETNSEAEAPQDAPEDDAPESQPIEAPASTVPETLKGLTGEELKVFQTLPPEAKAFLERREADRTADYTRKTQQVAEVRRAAETMATNLQQQLQQYSQILETITAPKLAPPDPALAHQDPGLYQEHLARYTQDKHLQELAAEEQRKVMAEYNALTTRQTQQFYQEEAQALQQLDPQLAASTEEGKKLRSQVFEYAQKSGYTPEQLRGASARDLVTLRKAMAYDAAQAVKAKVVQAPAPKAAKPAPAKTSSAPQALAGAIQALKSGTGNSRESLAAAYLAELKSERR